MNRPLISLAMKQIPILRSIERLPGGLMAVPMLIGATIVTFAPGTSKFFGSFTEALFSGALTILAVFYVCMGTTIELTATPYILKKGGSTLDLHKVVGAGPLGVALGLAAASTTGNAAAAPAIVAAANPAYSEAAKSATVLVAASVVVTAIVVPLVTAWWAGYVGSPSADGSSTSEGSAAAPTRREPH